MKINLLLLFILLYVNSFGQHNLYSYDASGNRIQRIYIVPRLANTKLPNDSTTLVAARYGISIYPNPAPDKINVSISSLEDGETAKVYLSDELGKVLLMQDQTSKLEALDLSNLKAGIYYIKVYIKQESVSYKIVKL